MSDCIVQLHYIHFDRNFESVFCMKMNGLHWQKQKKCGILDFIRTELCVDNAPYHVVALHASDGVGQAPKRTILDARNCNFDAIHDQGSCAAKTIVHQRWSPHSQ